MAGIDSLLIVPLREMLGVVINFIPTLVSLFLMLLVGIIFVKVFYDVLSWLFQELKLDKLSDQIGLSGLLQKGGIKSKLSELIIGIVHLIIAVMFLIIMAKMIGVTMASDLLAKLVSYLPHVVSAIFVLVLGLIVAKIMGGIIHMVVSIFNLPQPGLHETITHWAIIIYAFKLSLEELGLGFLFGGTLFQIWFAGLVLALALAFGIGGRDWASGYLKK